MRTIKLTILSVLFIFPLFYSCHENNEINFEDDFEMYKTYEFFTKSVEATSFVLKDKIRNTLNKGAIQLTQEDLDQCIQASGYSGTVPTLNEVNIIIDEVLNAGSNGQIIFPLQPSGFPPLNDRTNTLINEIFSTGSIEGLKLNEDFNQVSYSEQQVLEFINNIVYAMENGDIDLGILNKGNFCGVNGNPVPCPAAYAAAGAVIGSAFGGYGAIIGAIIGGVIGSFVGAS